MFESRIKKIRQKLLKEKLDGVLVSSTANITYLTGFTNFSEIEREAYVFIGRNFAYIITDGRYSEAVIKQVPHLTLFERGHKKSIQDLFKKYKKEIKKLGIEENNLTVSEYKVLSKHFKKTRHFEAGNLRSIKAKEEIQKIEKACQLGDAAFKFILKRIKTGVSEKEVAQDLEGFIKSKGATISFPPIVAFGKNAAIPHHQSGQTILGPESSSGQKGLIILFDFGVKLDNYCSDMTRTIFFGKLISEQKKIYQTVLETQQKAIDFINSAIRSGKEVKASEADKVARDYIISKGYPSIPHSLGHGIGLAVHERPALSPKSKEVLKEGMVFSIEPGIYIADFGGVRVEDLFVIEKNNLRQLTNASRKLTVI